MTSCPVSPGDHSLLQEQLDSGMITPKKRVSRKIKTLSPGLWGRADGDPEINEYPVQPGDVHLFCSDGLNDMLVDEEIQLVLQTLSVNLSLAAKQLVQMANDNGGRDNISVILVKILRAFSGVTAFTNRVASDGEADIEHGRSGFEGNCLDQGAHDDWPSSVQRYSDRQSGDQR